MDMLLLNPVIAILHNVANNRWYTILYYEAPLPGPPSDDKPVRHKSKGHHTVGFESRDLALEEAKKLGEQILVTNLSDNFKLCTNEDMVWDGEGTPADVAFFRPDPNNKAQAIRVM